MQLDLAGRVRNTSLPAYHALWPLFDALTNSIDAIEERGDKSGQVAITLARDTGQQRLPIPDQPDLRPVVSFLIEDNGVGFNRANYDSFNTADSGYKRQRGGKGIGRFIWLRAFDHVTIDSIFRDEASSNGLMRRTFTFRLPAGIDDEKVSPASGDAQLRTIVALRGYKSPWIDECPRSLDVLGSRVLDHCAGFFLRAMCPAVILRDDQQRQLLNDRFQKEYASAPALSFSTKGADFQVRHLRIRDAQAKHRLIFCANTREVRPQTSNIVDLPKRLPTESGDSYVLASYVTGELLDATVNNERTNFSLPDRDDALLPNQVALQDIADAALGTLRDQFAAEMERAADERRRRLEEYVETKAPEYRPLVRHHAERLRAIPVDASEQRLEQDLHRIKRELEQETRTQVTTLLEQADSMDDYDQRLEAVLQSANELGKAELVKYVAHRKLVLEILAKALRRDGVTGKYSLEEHVHRIIFPLRHSSDDVEFSQQNLWIIDERLAYHRYLASDVRLGGANAPERPDLFVFNRPISLADGGTLTSVVLVEFKRPMRDDFTDQENPIEQVYEYVRKIRAGAARDRQGRPIPVTDATLFYGHIVADLTPSLRKQAQNAGFFTAPDNQAFYFYNSPLRTWVDLTSYDNLVEDAEKRNRAFFERLGLPSG